MVQVEAKMQQRVYPSAEVPTYRKIVADREIDSTSSTSIDDRENVDFLRICSVSSRGGD